uniref:Olfactory receptor family 51 subfamily G member 2 n=1 Tax=Mus spicilegus TaxID=10103 RepID=A0A8C6MQT2_MUSSI
MFSLNDIQTLKFLLIGIPGLQKSHNWHMHIWISLPLCLMYVVSILGNCTILFIIKTEPSLHEPMYLFLSMLALTDLGLSLCTLPTVLGIFWVGARDISHDACFTQLFFIHCLSFLESSVLLSMAFDCFVAICRPLHYASILTHTVIVRIGLASLGLPFLIKRLPFCHPNILSHSYCLHQDMMRLACASTRVNSLYGLIIVILILGLDALTILFSYILILKTVLGISSRAERLKALNTCLSHICTVLLFYIPFIGATMIHRFGKHLSPIVHMLMANIYLLLPPLLNPIVYIMRMFQGRKSRA